jgi:hypothetical protein
VAHEQQLWNLAPPSVTNSTDTRPFVTPSHRKRNDFRSGSRKNEAERPHRTGCEMNALSESF